MTIDLHWNHEKSSASFNHKKEMTPRTEIHAVAISLNIFADQISREYMETVEQILAANQEDRPVDDLTWTWLVDTAYHLRQFREHAANLKRRIER